MEETEAKSIEKRSGFSLIKLIEEHLTVLDLSNKNIKTIADNMKLPINLTELNLSRTMLSEVPNSVLKLENLKILNLSHNQIEYFDDTPAFCQSIQLLNMSNNNLLGPPYWIWSKTPRNLSQINLSWNVNITKSFKDGHYEELLKYKSLATNIIIYNCKLDNHIELLGTFPNAKSLALGTIDLSCYSLNNVEEVPCNGLDRCCDIEYFNLSNTNIYNVNSNIDMYKNLKEIDLSHNKLECLPEEFCFLENLEICILSYNRLYNLPVKFCNLVKMRTLCLDSNELYMLPKGICQLSHIRKVDIYDNYLYEVPDGIENLFEVDLAQNYFEEPSNEQYLQKRNLIRANLDDRLDGRKVEDFKSDSEHSKDLSDDDLLTSTKSDKEDAEDRSLSSLEDWDSDDYWIPHLYRHSVPRNSPWLFYVKQKINEGNFCPMVAHPIPIADQVRYQKTCNPQVQSESDGQFDDFSGDDS